ncbi:hypothetical protein ATANTOWER_024497, partial [Ataeniobius toweri]|nr:hypothetical protein [Ataeniobius toweri]
HLSSTRCGGAACSTASSSRIAEPSGQRAEDAHFCHLYPGSLSFSHDLKFMTIGWVQSVCLCSQGVTGRCWGAAVAHQRAINLGSKGVEIRKEASARCLTSVTYSSLTWLRAYLLEIPILSADLVRIPERTYVCE